MLDSKILLEEIITMIEKIESSLTTKTIETFSLDFNLLDATLMRLHFIGENIKNIPTEIKKKYPKVRWKKFSRLRNIIGHKYSIVNKEIIWDVVKNSLPKLKKEIQEIIKKEKLLHRISANS